MTYTVYNTRQTETAVLDNAITLGHKGKDCGVWVLDNLKEEDLADVVNLNPWMFWLVRSFAKGDGGGMFKWITLDKAQETVKRLGDDIDRSLPSSIRHPEMRPVNTSYAQGARSR